MVSDLEKQAEAIRQSERQLQLVLKNVAGNIPVERFSDLILTVTVDGSYGYAVYRNNQFESVDGAVIAGCTPGCVISATWKPEGLSLSEACSAMGQPEAPEPIAEDDVNITQDIGVELESAEEEEESAEEDDDPEAIWA